MAQIFASHSKKDKDLRDFFSNAFASTKVRAVFEEFEAILTGERNAVQIANDIESSNAVFVILSSHVENLPHTRDWVLWETGVGRNKDIWIFEPARDYGHVSLAIPFLRHYVTFDLNDQWLGYLRMIVSSYDDSHMLPTLVTGSGIGAAVSEDKLMGALVGGGISLLLAANAQTRPGGIPTVCPNCRSSYNLHIAHSIFRCPVCNCHLRLGPM